MIPQRSPLPRSAGNVSQGYWGGQTYARESDVTVGTSVVRLAPNNPNRIELILTNYGQAVVALVLSNAGTATTGIAIAPNGGTATLLVTEDGELTFQEIFGVSAAANNAVHVVEIILV